MKSGIIGAKLTGISRPCLRLVDEIGFGPVDGGGPDKSWRHHPARPFFTADLDADGACAALQAAQRNPKTAWRL